MRAGLMRAELLKLKIKPKAGRHADRAGLHRHKIPCTLAMPIFGPLPKHFGLQLVLHGLIN